MTKQVRVLTGITTTGTPHLGNYVGAIRPAIMASQNTQNTSFYFLADFHALVKCWEPERIHQSTCEIAATWLACGLNAQHVIFYRQSDVPQITELSWILTCMTSKGLMNRAHAYKALVQENTIEKNQDSDKGITMGLFSYPILMTADILLFNANKVPVGKDQIQHIEMARDIAQRFNQCYEEIFCLPEAMINENTPIINGIDGRKMSKSYNNTIPLWSNSKDLRKFIMKIKTNSLEPGVPKDYTDCSLFKIFAALASEKEIQEKQNQYKEGASWGTLKEELFEYIDNVLKDQRTEYQSLMNHLGDVENILKQGAVKAQEIAQPLLDKVKKATGIRPL